MSNRDRSRNGSLFQAPQQQAAPQVVDQSIFGFSDSSRYALVEQNGTMEFGAFRLTPLGLEVGRQVTEDDWVQVGSLLGKLNGAVQWLMGDWLAYGERQWGKTYKDAEVIFGYEYQTLRDYVYVSQNVDLSIRIDKPQMFAHHRLVAPMSYNRELQNAWLRYVDAAGLKLAQMKRLLSLMVTQNPDWQIQALNYAISQSLDFSQMLQQINQLLGTVDSPTPSHNGLGDRVNRARFNKIWRNLSKIEAISLDDIHAMRKWLDAVEALKRG